jgi:hypothetical protein
MAQALGPSLTRFAAARLGEAANERLHNVSKTLVDSGGLGKMPENLSGETRDCESRR